MSCDPTPTHLESSLLEKVAEFGDDILETLLLPVYLRIVNIKKKKVSPSARL